MKKFGLKGKLMLLAILPTLIITIVFGVATAIRMDNAMTSSYKTSLRTAACSVRNILQEIDDGTYHVEGDALWLGPTDLSYVNTVLDELYEQTQMYSTIIINDTRMLTSVKNNGERAVGTQIDPGIASKVMGGEEHLATGVVVGGKKCVVCYVPLYQPKTDEVIGAVFTGMDQSTMESQIRTTIISIIAIGIGIMALVIVFAIIFSSRLARVIIASQRVCLDLADGNFSREEVSMGTKRKDELGEMARGVNTVKLKVGEAIVGIRDNIDMLLKDADGLTKTATTTSDTMGDLSNAVTGIADGATSQAQEVTTAADHVSDILAKMEMVNQNVDSTEENTIEMTKASKSVIDTFSHLISDIESSISNLDVIVEKMEAVANAVNDVTVAADDINGIAEQTNLLSLNASIEAARAGEAGQGFAVVAGEIRQLADQSRQSSDKINQIMGNLKIETAEAVEMVRELNDIMDRQKASSSESRDSIEGLVENIEQTKNMVTDIKNSSDEVKDLCASLNDNVSNLSAISEENAASSQETAASVEQISNAVYEVSDMSDELKKLSNHLAELIDFFKI